MNVPLHFILLQLNHFDLGVDKKRWWLEHSFSFFRVWLSAEGAKNVLSSLICIIRGRLLRERGSLTMAFTSKPVCIKLTVLSCYGSIPLKFALMRTYGVLSNLFHSCGFDYQYSLLGEWGNLTVAFTGKFVCI